MPTYRRNFPGFEELWPDSHKIVVKGGPYDGLTHIPSLSVWNFYWSKDVYEVRYVDLWWNRNRSSLKTLNFSLEDKHLNYDESRNLARRMIDNTGEHKLEEVVYRFDGWHKPNWYNRRRAIYKYVGTFDVEAVGGVYHWYLDTVD